jgi:hypothetical protein
MDLVKPPRPFTLAADDHRRRIWSVKTAPPLTTAKDLGLKETKTQGLSVKPVTQVNSVIRDSFVIFVANFEIPYKFREKSEKYKS